MPFSYNLFEFIINIEVISYLKMMGMSNIPIHDFFTKTNIAYLIHFNNKLDRFFLLLKRSEIS